MKRILLFIILLTGSISFAHAQDNEPDPGKKVQKIQALYVAYISQQLNLTTAEAEKFWPLHNQFDGELKTIGMDLPELDRQQKLLDVKKRYQDRFVKILGTGRADNFFRLNTEFNKKLVDVMRQRRQQNNMNQRPLRRNN
ncbi:hypothetical protein BH11BAC4_BH11BAC4_00220 [soil metagenome]